MFTELFIQDKLNEGIEKGRKLGIEQGREQGRAEGREQGSLHTIFSFYQDGVISLEAAAAKAGLSTEDFLARVNALMTKE